MTDDVAHVVEAARGGDRSAFGELYARFARMVHGVLLARGSRADVDDLVQDVFVIALEQLHTLRDAHAFASWLAAIARNRAADQLRRGAARTVELTDELGRMDPDRTEALAVLGVIRTLPEAYRETLVLRLVEGMTGPEIAARTGLTAASVRVEPPSRHEAASRATGSPGVNVENDDYLWDRSGTPDPDVERLERMLASLAQQNPPPHMLLPESGMGKRPFRAYAALATAAAILIGVLLGGTAFVRRMNSQAWDLTRAGGNPTISSRPVGAGARLPVGGWLETDEHSTASLNVGTIGRISVEPGTRLRLVSARSGDHRLQLERGTLHATIWAPPGHFSVETASSTAVDLGCAYTLTMDDNGEGLVSVLVGWVGFEWRGRESLVPAGSMSVTRPGKGPGTPYNERVSRTFREALAAIDFASDAPDASAALSRVLDEAQERDEVTLWHLLTRVNGADRDRVFDRLAQFVPPPSTVTRDGIRAGRRDMLDAWWDALGLGTAAWWRTWKRPPADLEK